MATSKKPRKRYQQKHIYEPTWLVLARILLPIKTALDDLFNDSALVIRDEHGDEIVGARVGYANVMTLHEALEDIARHIETYQCETGNTITHLSSVFELAEALKNDTTVSVNVYHQCMAAFSQFESLARQSKDPFLQKRIHEINIKKHGQMIFAQ